jgi:hypothetical protein
LREETVDLFHCNLGYFPTARRSTSTVAALRCLARCGGVIENLKLYTPDRAADLRVARISSDHQLREIVEHLEERVRPFPGLHNLMLVAYGKLDPRDKDWLELRVERDLLSVSGERSGASFLSSAAGAAARVDALLSLAESILEAAELVDCVGTSLGKTTFFLGQPELLYRPSLLDRFFDRDREEVSRQFWEMRSAVGHVFPLERVVALLRESGAEYKRLGPEHIGVRFCKALDQPIADGKAILRSVAELVDEALRRNHVQRTWDKECADLPDLER